MPGSNLRSPRISVVVPHLNQPDHLARCLAALAAGHRRPDEIFVVDNGSDVLPDDVCAAHAAVTLLVELEPGPGPARNSGVAASSGEILAFIDADCTASPEWLAVAEREMADPGAQILGGDVRIAVADPYRLTPIEAYESEYAYRMDRYIAREGFTGTGNLVVRRAIYDAIGPFGALDIAEDRDWGQRATAQGYAIRYVPELRVFHPARPDFAEIFRKWDRQTAHDYARALGQRAGRTRFAIKTVAMGGSPLAEIPRILASNRIQGARTRGLAFIALTRIRLYRAWRMLRLLLRGDHADLSRGWNRGRAR
ncbi:MAG: glycosyltransferase [Planctomycetes bacterium]|nr:glycosyltransferase [Planctomycetota bacterium]